jgi:hypothetical protein
VFTVRFLFGFGSRYWFLRDYPCFSSTFGGSRGHFHLVSHRRSLLRVTSSLQVLKPLNSKIDMSGFHLPANFENLAQAGVVDARIKHREMCGRLQCTPSLSFLREREKLEGQLRLGDKVF